MEPPLENFKVCALQYLNDWYKYDVRFVSGLSARNDDGVRLRSMGRMAQNYGIARNFKVLDEPRLKRALELLDEIAAQINDDNVDSKVQLLAEEFDRAYGKYAISAASKFLWMLRRNQVVIYDNRAMKGLQERCGRKFSQGDYAAYRKEWLGSFAMSKESICSACAAVVGVKEFSLAYKESDDDLRELVANTWFHQRVFDKFLWGSAENKTASYPEMDDNG